MKKVTTVLVAVLLTLTSFGQLVSENKDYILVDSVDLTKSEIYAKTKYFIADNWNSSSAVTQLDDKENGIILLRGTHVTKIYLQSMRTYIYTYTFKYTIEFRMRDNKFKMTIKDIDNSNRNCDYSGCNIKKLYLSYNTIDKCVKSTLPNRKLISKEMVELDNFFNLFVQTYGATLNNNNLNFNNDF
tara:strand:+ start:21 stop:578 length:558 start_codon:yes stop_codon:yes gene_type:complete